MMKVDMQVPIYRKQIHLQTFKAPSNPVEHQAEPIHLLVDSTGLKVYGEGYGAVRWKVRKHGADIRRIWRKLHLVADEATNIIHAVELTSHSTCDAEMVKPLLDATEWRISTLSGDEAYDQVRFTTNWKLAKFNLLSATI